MLFGFIATPSNPNPVQVELWADGTTPTASEPETEPETPDEATTPPEPAPEPQPEPAPEPTPQPDPTPPPPPPPPTAPKSVVYGTSVSVRVDLGGRRILKKKIIPPPNINE